MIMTKPFVFTLGYLTCYTVVEFVVHFLL